MTIQTQKDLIQILKDFALSESRINAIYQGHHPEEENHPVYYFLIKHPFDFEFTDRVSDLSFKIPDTDLLEWPCSIEQAEDYSFLGECIWKRKLIHRLK
ncbi:hypothetical protein HOE04_04825 [archaeon]|jgi:hypothetical protein|nr:hypothetical protein [archaeon]